MCWKVNNTADDPHGPGYEIEPPLTQTLAHGADDLWKLNESRLAGLRKYGIYQEGLERLHSRAEDFLTSAKDDGGARPEQALAMNQAAAGFSSLVYDPVRQVTDDLVHAVVVILLMAIPFAFALERLLIGTSNIYKQICGFAGIFLSVFVVLYFVHPAFRFASFPVVVLLAFLTIIMSGIVISIMWAKFEYEVKNLQGIATASHRTTRTSRGTVAAAVALGISTMRRRPLRTTLTAVTIVLLAFTILFFGSFNAESGVRWTYVGPASGERQVVIRLSGARRLPPERVESLRQLWSGEAESFARQWGTAAQGSSLPMVLANGKVMALAGWSGISSRDLELQPALRAALSGDVDGFVRDGGVFLPPQSFEAFKTAGGEVSRGEVKWLGQAWVVRGTFDPKALRQVRTLDGGALVPPDIEETRRQLEARYPREPEAVEQKLREMEPSAFPLSDAEMVGLVSMPPMEGGDAAMPADSLVIIPRSDEAAERIAGEAATLMGGDRVTASFKGQVVRAIYAPNVSFSGASRLLPPLILGGLIIFGTMLSSVADREREIFTFSALGLAPPHIGVLFFAEAMVYAIVGGMGGYLFSQVFGKIVELMAHAGWVTAPAMNYSSMNAMVTLLIVMATVLISTIYPAYRASRSANPGIQRRWRIPKPDGDRHHIDFPFTVAEYDLVGLITFLEEYMAAHRDKSVGSFAADEVVVTRGEQGFVLDAKVWLKPFDQGVSQTFRLSTVPSDIEGIGAVKLELVRLSGPPAIWERSNKVFVNDIRQQFIFWRTIDEAMMEHYHDTAAKRFGLSAAEAQPA